MLTSLLDNDILKSIEKSGVAQGLSEVIYASTMFEKVLPFILNKT